MIYYSLSAPTMSTTSSGVPPQGMRMTQELNEIIGKKKLAPPPSSMSAIEAAGRAAAAVDGVASAPTQDGEHIPQAPEPGLTLPVGAMPSASLGGIPHAPGQAQHSLPPNPVPANSVPASTAQAPTAATSSSQPSGVPPSSSGSTGPAPPSSKQKKTNGLRRGKWTSEEENYANRLIQEFKSGLLPLTDGTTLRTFLSKLLNCDPMRISKKFVGSNCIGKQVFRRRQADMDRLTLEDIERSRQELADLERRFLDRVAQTSRCKTGALGSKSKDAGAGIGGELGLRTGHGSMFPPPNHSVAPWMLPPQQPPQNHMPSRYPEGMQQGQQDTSWMGGPRGPYQTSPPHHSSTGPGYGPPPGFDDGPGGMGGGGYPPSGGHGHYPGLGGGGGAGSYPHYGSQQYGGHAPPSGAMGYPPPNHGFSGEPMPPHPQFQTPYHGQLHHHNPHHPHHSPPPTHQGFPDHNYPASSQPGYDLVPSHSMGSLDALVGLDLPSVQSLESMTRPTSTGDVHDHIAGRASASSGGGAAEGDGRSSSGVSGRGVGGSGTGAAHSGMEGGTSHAGTLPGKGPGSEGHGNSGPGNGRSSFSPPKDSSGGWRGPSFGSLGSLSHDGPGPDTDDSSSNMPPPTRVQPAPSGTSPRMGGLPPPHLAGAGQSYPPGSLRGGGAPQQAGSGHMMRSQSAHKLRDMSRNSSVEDFLSLVESGDIPAPDQDMLSTSIFQSLQHAGDKRGADERSNQAQAPSLKIAKAE